MKFILLFIISFSLFSQTHTSTGSGGRTADYEQDTLECKKLKQSLLVLESRFLSKNKQEIEFDQYIKKLIQDKAIKSLKHISNEPQITKDNCPCQEEGLLERIYMGLEKSKELSCTSAYLLESQKLMDDIKTLFKGN